MKLNVLKAEQIKNGEIPLEEAYKLYGAEAVDYAVAELQKSDEEILAKYSAADMKAAIFGKPRPQTACSDMKQNHPETAFSKGRCFDPFGYRSGQAFAQHDSFRSKQSRPRSVSAFTVTKVAGIAAVLIIAFGFAFTQISTKSKFSAIPQSTDVAEKTTAFQNPETRAKGAATGGIMLDEADESNLFQLVLYKKTSEGTVVLKSGDEAGEGDLVQISYFPGAYKYGIIFSVDGNKNVTKHFPDKTWTASPLGNRADLLDFSYELDDAPDFEDFIFLASKDCFSISEKDAYKVFAEKDYLGKKLGNVSKTEVFVNKK